MNHVAFVGAAPERPAAISEVPGPVLFARYAFPPNHHGYCGPADTLSFFEYGATGSDSRELRALAREFAGAWPYLELIAGATGLTDPLDRRAVEAYWVGSPRLDMVGTVATGDSMDERFRFRAGPHFGNLTDGVLAGGVPHHSFAVFCVYPWVGLLGNDRHAEHALTVLDMCRIRWGKVLTTEGDSAVVESRHLTWDGHRLELAAPTTEIVARAKDGVGLSPTLTPGCWVSMHWEWICDVLAAHQLASLRRFTMRHVQIVNAAGPARMSQVLG